MLNKGIHASFINLNDNVPFERVYKSKERFVSAFKRMKNAEFTGAIDFDKIDLIAPEELQNLIN